MDEKRRAELEWLKNRLKNILCASFDLRQFGGRDFRGVK